MANPLKVLTDLHISGASGTSTIVNGAISGSSNLSVGGTSTLTGDVTFGGNIVADANENKSIFAAVTTQTITVGAAGATVSIPGTASVGGNLTVTGDLTVNGTTTTINSTTLTVDDKNIVLASGAANDAAADGGGITLESGDGNKTFNWLNSTDSWTSSEHLSITSGKNLKLGSVSVLASGNLNNNFTGSHFSNGNQEAYLGIGYVSSSALGYANTASVLLAAENLLYANAGQIVLLGQAGQGEEGVRISAAGGGDVFLDASANSSAAITLNANKVLVKYDGGNFTGYVDGGKLNLTGVLDAISSSLGGGSGGGISSANYHSVRSAHVYGLYSGFQGRYTVRLSGTNNFVSADSGEGLGNNFYVGAVTGLTGSSQEQLLDRLGYASFDVATKVSGTNTWTNDLISVQITASNSGSSYWYPVFVIEAPGLTLGVGNNETKLRLIVVNEATGNLG